MTKNILLFLLLGCGLMTGLVQASVPATRSIEARLKNIGEFFCRHTIAGTVKQLKDSRNVPDVVRVGQNLPDILADMRPALLQGYTVEVMKGEPGRGDDERVTHSILIRCDHDAICLRMQYDAIDDRIHIIGYCGAEPRLQPPVKK